MPRTRTKPKTNRQMPSQQPQQLYYSIIDGVTASLRQAIEDPDSPLANMSENLIGELDVLWRLRLTQTSKFWSMQKQQSASSSTETSAFSAKRDSSSFAFVNIARPPTYGGRVLAIDSSSPLSKPTSSILDSIKLRSQGGKHVRELVPIEPQSEPQPTEQPKEATVQKGKQPADRPQKVTDKQPEEDEGKEIAVEEIEKPPEPPRRRVGRPRKVQRPPPAPLVTRTDQDQEAVVAHDTGSSRSSSNRSQDDPISRDALAEERKVSVEDAEKPQEPPRRKVGRPRKMPRTTPARNEVSKKPIEEISVIVLDDDPDGKDVEEQDEVQENAPRSTAKRPRKAAPLLSGAVGRLFARKMKVSSAIQQLREEANAAQLDESDSDFVPSCLPQLDGKYDSSSQEDEDNDDDDEDNDSDDEELGDDDDLGSDDDYVEEGNVDEELDDLLLCQYRNAPRRRGNSLSATLFSGMMNCNGVDYLFSRAQVSLKQ